MNTRGRSEHYQKLPVQFSEQDGICLWSDALWAWSRSVNEPYKKNVSLSNLFIPLKKFESQMLETDVQSELCRVRQWL